MSKPKTYKTTEAHFKIFKAECEKWIDIFSLRSWEIHFRHENNEENLVWIAWCRTNWADRVATLGLSANWSVKPEEDQIKRSAFHEVCELLLSRLETEAMCDTCPTQKDNIGEQKHAIIRRLEHVVFDGKKK